MMSGHVQGLDPRYPVGYAERDNTARGVHNDDAVALLEELASEMDAASEAM